MLQLALSVIFLDAFGIFVTNNLFFLSLTPTTLLPYYHYSSGLFAVFKIVNSDKSIIMFAILWERKLYY